MARRELRAGWRHLLPLLVSVTLGVAALVAVGTVGAALDARLAREGKVLMGGDLELRSARPLDAPTEAVLRGLGARGASLTRVRELAAMARTRDGRSLLVELKAIDDRYPLYGRLEHRPAHAMAELRAGQGALVEPALLKRLGVAPGDTIWIGDRAITIGGIVEREPDRATGLLRLGPRILVSAGALDGTGLIRPGSRVRYRALLRLPAPLATREARQALARGLADPAVRVTSYDDAQPGLRRFWTQLVAYLGLVGLVSLLVGGIGVATAIGAFVRRRRPTIAVLKCLGAETRVLQASYLLQALGLGLGGSLVGAAAGLAVQPLLGRVLAPVLPFALEPRLDLPSLARGVAMGSLTTLLATLWPLATIGAVPPASILRQEVAPEPPRRRPWRAAVPVGLGLAALGIWQAGSVGVGAIFVGAAGASALSLVAVARLLVRLSGVTPGRCGFAWRHGLAGLGRPGGHTTSVVVALGLGVTLLGALAVLERSLGRQMDHERRQETPSFFFIDIQPDQRAALTRVVRDVAGVEPALTPVVRSRLAAVDRIPVTRRMVDQRRQRGDDRTWYLTRDYVLTWAPAPPTTNVLTRGRWWTPSEAIARPRASVEEEAARYLGIDVGSTLTFDVQGTPVEIEVLSLRRVDWQTLSTNFFVIVSPGALEGAPTTYVATARVPPGVEAPLQDAVAAALPNVTAIPVRDVIARVGRLIDQIAAAIRGLAVVCVAAGLVVMAGALAASRQQRLYESMILRTLGASRGAVARAFAVEYACLGAAAGVGGAVLAAALAWAILRFGLEAPWAPAPGTLAGGVILSTGLALLVGFLGTWRLLGRKPLPVLRRE
jgi:putative ABC transport system permease protein